MKISASIPIRVAPSQTLWEPVRWRITSKRSLRWRIRRFAASGSRVERYLCARWVDGACLGALVVSVLYFVPTLLPLLLR